MFEEIREKLILTNVAYWIIQEIIDNASPQDNVKENALLILLCKKPNELLTRKEALEKIWGEDNYFTMRSMDVYVTKLRKHLKSQKHIKIENIHGDGYVLKIS